MEICFFVVFLFVVAECLGWTTTLLLGVFLAVPTAAPGAQHGTTQSKILKSTICAENPSFYGVSWKKHGETIYKWWIFNYGPMGKNQMEDASKLC